MRVSGSQAYGNDISLGDKIRPGWASKASSASQGTSG